MVFLSKALIWLPEWRNVGWLWWLTEWIWKISLFANLMSGGGYCRRKDSVQGDGDQWRAPCLQPNWAGNESELSFLLLINLAPRWRCRECYNGQAQISSCWWTKDHAARMAKNIFACRPNLAQSGRLWLYRYAFVASTKNWKQVRQDIIPTPCNKRWKTKTVTPLLTKERKAGTQPQWPKAIDAWFDPQLPIRDRQTTRGLKTKFCSARADLSTTVA